jgi:hypothetical protein
MSNHTRAAFAFQDERTQSQWIERLIIIRSPGSGNQIVYAAGRENDFTYKGFGIHQNWDVGIGVFAKLEGIPIDALVKLTDVQSHAWARRCP